MPHAGLARSPLVPRLVLLAALLLGSLLPGGISVTARAEVTPDTIVVTSTADAADLDPGDSICAAPAAGGACTLRAAIQTANRRTDWSIPVVVQLAAGTYPLTIQGANEDDGFTGDLDIRRPVEVKGPTTSATADAVIAAAGLGERAFDLHNPSGGADIIIRLIKLSIRDAAGSEKGGAVLARERVQVFLSYSDLRGNRASRAGGGLYVMDAAYVHSADIIENATISGDGPGGGGIYAEGFLSIEASTIMDNVTAGSGGGIYSTVAGNNPNAGAYLRYSSVLFNEAHQGGGIYAAREFSARNATIHGNRAERGGGIFLPYFASGPVTFRNATIANNTTEEGWGGLDSITSTQALNIAAYNSVFANNLRKPVPFQPANCGPMISFDAARHNLSSDTTCTLNGPGNIANTPAKLGQLKVFGPYGFGIPPLPDSPLIDAGLDSECEAYDTRTVERPQGAHCDIGAVELLPSEIPSPPPSPSPSPSPPPPPSPTATTPPGKLPTPTINPTATATRRPKSTTVPTPIPPLPPQPTPPEQ